MTAVYSVVYDALAPLPEDGAAVDALLDQARSAGDPFLAVTLYEKVLRSRPDDTTVMGEAADLMLHAGETEAAKEVRQSLLHNARQYGDYDRRRES